MSHEPALEGDTARPSDPSAAPEPAAGADFAHGADAAGGPVATQEQVEGLRARLEEILPRSIEDLSALVRIPSIAFPGYDRTPVHESAEAVAALLRDAGMPEVTITHVDEGAPAVIARRPAREGLPTVLLYAHHDVQPTGDPQAWTTDPFTPAREGDRLFGRGAADDKAGVMAHVTALRLVGEELSELGVGVTVFVEGEEEAGSPTFRRFIEAHRDQLEADAIVVADSANWAVGTPALTTSLRGVVDLTVTVRVLERAVHSGMFGGPVLDALTQMGRLVATLHDENGDVAVEGLVRAEAPAVEMPEADYRRDAGILEGQDLAGTGSITSRLWSAPALSVIGIDAPSVRDASNTLVPAARAKISLRIPPGQDPQAAMDALVAHLESHAPRGAVVEIARGEQGRPFLAPTDTPAMRLARSAFRDAWGTDPVDTGLGGSIPFIADLLEVFPGAEVLVTGVEDPDSRAHGVDESLHLGEFAKVCLAEALLLRGAAGLERRRG
ncbi:dipeptidase [Brachybacterium sp. MASK1Z-5]|uniref:Dipeptidase n=1 Tax=Brachybacterium halotolerans TaxID=2795215 RepID=A0ABS1B5C3_9MICO|nr:dipeptidase [Brachybacterium halotolerans]MBK0329836.1 dipeptidase [Brachybacterium halotolerans]